LGVTLLMMLCWAGAPAVSAQDLQPELDLPQESGPAQVKPPQPPSGKVQPEKGVVPPPAEAVPEKSQETPQAESKKRPEGEELKTVSKRVLNVLTTDNGTNLTAIVGRLQFSSQYRDRWDGIVQLDAVGRVDIPLNKRVLLRMDIPYLWLNQSASGSSAVSGLSDVTVRLGAIAWQRPGFTFFAGADVIIPTAIDSDLGRGKYLLGPGVAANIPIAALNSVFFPLLEHLVSVGGDPSRPDLSYTRISAELTTPWSKTWWTSVEPTLITDWNQHAKTAMNLEFEAGRRLGEHYRVWARPAVGLWGTGVPGAYDWYMQVGIRYMF
jgi:hypothetical protein